MNFGETAMQTELRALTRRFADKELWPIIEEDERAARFRPELIRKLGELGLAGKEMLCLHLSIPCCTLLRMRR